MWYHGTIQGITSTGHLVFFDGYEADGASEMTLHLIRDLVPTEIVSTSGNTERPTPPHPTVNSTQRRDAGQFTANQHPQRDSGGFHGDRNTGNGGDGDGNAGNGGDGDGNAGNGGTVGVQTPH